MNAGTRDAIDAPRSHRTPIETTELKKLRFGDLVIRADALGVPNEPGLRVPDLIHRIELAMLRNRDLLVGAGS